MAAALDPDAARGRARRRAVPDGGARHRHLLRARRPEPDPGRGALLPGRLHRRPRSAALDSVGLADRCNHLPSELSGGQQQRMAVARALAQEPGVLLADEPTGNLDEDTREEIMGLLEGLWRDRGLTLILVTHDSSIARRAERVAAMVKGKLTIRRDRRGSPEVEPRPAGS